MFSVAAATRSRLLHEGAKPGAHAYYQITRDGKPADGQNNSMMMGVVTFTGPAVYTDAEKFQKVEFADIQKGKAKFSTKADNGWLAMVQHYFVSAWLPAPGVAREFYMRKVGEDMYSAGVILPVATDGKSTITLYAGPQEQDKAGKDCAGARPGSGLWLADRDRRAPCSGCWVQFTSWSATGGGPSSV
jgi:YidC/Oxa1 family membrane protein insertase